MFTQITQQAHRFDELTTLQFGWHFTASQLAPSETVSKVSLYQTRNVGYNRFHLNSPYDQRLYVRDGLVSIGLLDSDNPTTWLYDQAIPNNGLIIFPRDDCMRAVSPVGFRGSGLHFSRIFLEQLLEPIYNRPLKELLPPAGIYLPDANKLAMLRAELHKWRQLVGHRANHRTAIVSRREESIALAVFDALIDGKAIEKPGLKKAERSLARALEIIHDSNRPNISALDLCGHANCSQRTLENIFIARFGVTPKKYINSLRIAKVHRGLMNFDASDCNSIIELASIHGFWHMGQFAADYRRMYGELPSATLNRS